MRTLIILLVLATTLQACGLKGPLALPSAAPAKPAPPAASAAPAQNPQQEK